MSAFANAYTAEMSLELHGVCQTPDGNTQNHLAFGQADDFGFLMGVDKSGAVLPRDTALIGLRSPRHVTHGGIVPAYGGDRVYLLQNSTVERDVPPVLLRLSREMDLHWGIEVQDVKKRIGPSLLAVPTHIRDPLYLAAVLSPTESRSGLGYTVTCVKENGNGATRIHVHTDVSITAKSIKFVKDRLLVVVGEAKYGDGIHGFVHYLNCEDFSSEFGLVMLDKNKDGLRLGFDALSNSGRRLMGTLQSDGYQRHILYGTRQKDSVFILPTKVGIEKGCAATTDSLGVVVPLGSNSPVMAVQRGQSQTGLHSALSLDPPVSLSGVILDGSDNDRPDIICTGRTSERRDAVLLKFAQDLSCCCLDDAAPMDRLDKLPVTFKQIDIKGEVDRCPLKIVNVALKPIDVSSRVLCRPGTGGDTPKPGHWPAPDDQLDQPFAPTDRMHVQSSLLAIETAGSMGVRAARGNLIRWDFMGALGDHHLPKGDFSAGPPRIDAQGRPILNRTDDFVRLYKFPVSRKADWRKLDLQGSPPGYVDDATATFGYVVGDGQIMIRFDKAAHYDPLRAIYDPQTDWRVFLASDTASFQIEFQAMPAYAAILDVQTDPAASPVRFAAGSSLYAQPGQDPDVVARGSHVPTSQGKIEIHAPNITQLWVRANGSPLLAIRLATYSDMMRTAHRKGSITPVGRFALTDDSTTARIRFDTAEPSQVHGHWPKFSGDAKVNSASYNTRFTASNSGLVEAIRTYRTLSETDPTATGVIHDDPLPGQQSAGMSVSYLDILKLAATDFHIARMFGLGCVDSEAAVQSNAAYAYMIVYDVPLDLAGPGSRGQHLSVSMPTWPAHERLPDPVSAHNISYGLNITATGTQPYSLTDAQGYTPDGEARYINHQLRHPTYHQSFGPSPVDGTAFSYGRETVPSFFTLDYRSDNESAWRSPSLSADRVFVDTAGQPEVLPSPFRDDFTQTAFVHQEFEDGVHHYTAGAIDLFSRRANDGPIAKTDFTVLRPPNGLLPPSNIRVQLIQIEDPAALLFTTALEQTALSSVPTGQDKTLIRVHFEYNHVQEQNYALPQSWRNRQPQPDNVFADKIDIHFRNEMPRTVEGHVFRIDTVGLGKFAFHTQSTTLPSTNDVLTPELPVADIGRFIGSAFVYEQMQYIVTGISHPIGSMSANPIFQVRISSDDQIGISDAGGVPTLNTQIVPPAPAIGGLCLCVENMASLSNWGGSPLGLSVDVSHPNWQIREELETDPLGNTRIRPVRGFWESGQLSALGSAAAHEYKLVFDSFDRPPHPQENPVYPGAPVPSVSYRKGVIRAPIAGSDDRRVLEVFAEDWSVGSRILYLRDTKALAQIAQNSPPLPQLELAPNTEFNYYPAFALYLRADASAQLTETNILPDLGEGIRQSILSFVARDSDVKDNAGEPYRSAISVPTSILAQEIRRPSVPHAPYGVGYLTPPDQYDKSSYRLNLNVRPDGHTPFAVIFLRTDTASVLSALYDVERRKAVMSRIFPLAVDPSYSERFAEIFSVRTDALPAFTAFTLADGTDYALPEPNSLDMASADMHVLLKALYAPDTRRVIESRIFPAEQDASFAARLSKLQEFRTMSSVSLQSRPINDTENYTLPAPDHPDLGNRLQAGGLIAAYDSKPGRYVQDALRERFVALSEQPLLYEHIPLWQDGHRPHKGPQNVRGADGRPLTQEDAGFDIAPMAVRYSPPTQSELSAMTVAALRNHLVGCGLEYIPSATKAVLRAQVEAFYADKPDMQCVDFTVSGSKHPDTLYFYAAQELGNKMEMGGLSGVHGPVHTVNRRAPNAPLIRRVLADNRALTPPAVRLYFSRPAEYENVHALNIYRTTSGLDAQSLNTMKIVKTISLANLKIDAESGELIAEDLFEDDVFPFGEPVFYRLCLVRHSTYADDSGQLLTASISSLPSKVYLTNISDTRAPRVDAPSVTHTQNTSDTSLADITLTWSSAAHNCTYYPEMLSPAGIWQRLGEIKSNDPVLTYPETNMDPLTLPKVDEYGDPIVYEFRISSVNSSGLINKVDRVTMLEITS